ncbi:peptidylprolyl isomerase [Chloroflexota bacterium]
MKKPLISILVVALLLVPLIAAACSDSDPHLNNPPKPPSSPLPGDGATGVSINTELNWVGEDLEEDRVTYDVYFGTSETFTDPVENNWSATTYTPGALSYSTHYYWKIVATDEHGSSTEGPIWDFTTASTSNNRIAVLETSMGTVEFEIYEDKVPTTAINFINLANSGFYDGLIFHRVKDNFIIQTGDPTGMGPGGSGTTIDRELHSELKHYDGAVGMARGSNPNSATSQFYICDGAQHGLDDRYAVFGQVIGGMDVVRAIAAVPVDGNDRPLDNVVVSHITITD